jgi:hypothetical protein
MISKTKITTKTSMKSITKLALAALVSVTCLTYSYAGTIDFENMPQAYWYYGGQQNFGNYWEGVNFGPASTILEDQVYGYNSPGYPPHSGHAVLFSITTPYIDATFDNAVDSVGLWYSSTSSFVMDAYDSANNLIASVTGGSVYGANAFLEVTYATKDIARVRMHDSGNYFTIDDFTADIVTGQPSGAPDGGLSILLLGGALTMLGGFSRKFRK